MPEEIKDMTKYVEMRYNDAIKYYWNASRHNKYTYKWTQGLTLGLGALVTLFASLSSAEFVRDDYTLEIFFGFATPFLAAALTIAAGFAQTFQWGAAWQDMVVTAQKLEKERDRFTVAKSEHRDLEKEVELLNDFILTESQGFFQRMLGTRQNFKNTKGSTPHQSTRTALISMCPVPDIG